MCMCGCSPTPIMGSPEADMSSPRVGSRKRIPPLVAKSLGPPPEHPNVGSPITVTRPESKRSKAKLSAAECSCPSKTPHC